MTFKRRYGFTPMGTPVRRCSKCQRMLPLGAFGRDRSRDDGLHDRCKQCRHCEYVNARHALVERQ